MKSKKSTKNKVSTKRTPNKTASKKPDKKQKKLPKTIQIGQTLESNDKFLPHDKRKVPASKSRPVIVVDKKKNTKGEEEFAVVPGSKQNTPNTKYYGKNGIKFFRKVLEVEDNEGRPIKEGEKFKKTSKCTKLPIKDVEKIKDEVLNHGKRASENRKNFLKFKNRK